VLAFLIRVIYDPLSTIQSIGPMPAQRRSAPRKMSEKRLRNIAVYYCQRYLVSGGKLTAHLNKRLYREVADSEEREGFAAFIPTIVADLTEKGLVNDREAASARLRSALRSGYASGAAVTVAARGAVVDREVVEQELEIALTEALPELDVDPDEIEATETTMEQAALALKRARRGPYRSRPQDDKSRRRDAGWLQRRGFRLDAIKHALDIDPLDE
jgi:SOS response regulatory protein OraA/RecX